MDRKNIVENLTQILDELPDTLNEAENKKRDEIKCILRKINIKEEC